jgi:hypothetical protein
MTFACLCVPLQGEPLRNRAPSSQQDDRLHHGAVRHGAHLQRPGAQTGQAHYPEDGRGPHEGPQRSVTASIFCFSFAPFLCSLNFHCVCARASLFSIVPCLPVDRARSCRVTDDTVHSIYMAVSSSPVNITLFVLSSFKHSVSETQLLLLLVDLFKDSVITEPV